MGLIIITISLHQKNDLHHYEFTVVNKESSPNPIWINSPDWLQYQIAPHMSKKVWKNIIKGLIWNSPIKNNQIEPFHIAIQAKNEAGVVYLFDTTTQYVYYQDLIISDFTNCEPLFDLLDVVSSGSINFV